MVHKVVALGLMLLLTLCLIVGCGKYDPLTPCDAAKAERKEWENKPHLVSTAPDGTKLWEARLYKDREGGKYFYYDTVYFSSNGTQRTVSSGKSTRQEIVPAAN